MDNKLKIHKPRWLPCDVCGQRIYDYEKCISPYIYCSYNCLSILILSNKNGMLHEDSVDFGMKRVESKDDLTVYKVDDKNSVSSHDSWWSVNHAQEFAEMFQQAAKVVEKLEIDK